MSKKFVLLAVIAALSLCAFANVEKSQAHAGVRFGSASTVAFGGVTNIKEVVNNTSGIVRVEKAEFTGNVFTTRYEASGAIPANGVWSGEMWIPWADNAEDFRNHGMSLVVTLPNRPQGFTITRFKIWQSGEYVRFTDGERFVNNAPRVPGEARAGGERRMIVSIKDNRPVFTFEKYQP